MKILLERAGNSQGEWKRTDRNKKADSGYNFIKYEGRLKISF
jgi:hypothetical protein